MMTSKSIYPTLFFLFLGYSAIAQSWFKGNLHTHSLWSDGDDFPEMILQWYKDHGYQFVALSDHNSVAEGEFWYEIKEREVRNRTLEKYLDKFGDWVEVRREANSTYVRLKTYEEYKAKMEIPESFTIIRSEEVTSQFEKKPVHINVSNIQEKIEPIKGSSVLDIMQQTINKVREQREQFNIPMFAHINHPNFGYGVNVEDMKNLNGERFFEVYNGHPAVHNEGDAFHMDTETMWDLINIHYHKKGQPLLLGIATDDSHHYHESSSDLSNTGRGWVMVQSEDLSANNLIEAMEEGQFYASSGVILNQLIESNEGISLEIQGEEGAEYEISFMSYRKGNSEVVTAKTVKGQRASYQFEPGDIFVRAKITSTALIENPYQVGETKKAWTQPILVQ